MSLIWPLLGRPLVMIAVIVGLAMLATKLRRPAEGSDEPLVGAPAWDPPAVEEPSGSAGPEDDPHAYQAELAWRTARNAMHAAFVATARTAELEQRLRMLE